MSGASVHGPFAAAVSESDADVTSGAVSSDANAAASAGRLASNAPDIGQTQPTQLMDHDPDANSPTDGTYHAGTAGHRHDSVDEDEDEDAGVGNVGGTMTAPT